MSALSGIANAQQLLKTASCLVFNLRKAAKASATFVGFGKLDRLPKSVVMFGCNTKAEIVGEACRYN